MASGCVCVANRGTKKNLLINNLKMDEIISQIDVAAIQESIRKGIEYGGEFFLRFQSFAIVSSLVWIIISFLLFLIPFLFYRIVWDYLTDADAEPVIVIPLFIQAIILGILCVNIYSLIEAIYVPELYLLDMIMNRNVHL